MATTRDSRFLGYSGVLDHTATVENESELIASAGRGSARMEGHSMFSVFLRILRGLPLSNSVPVLFSTPCSYRWKCPACEAYLW
jgi:hypothetical protein